MKTSPMQRDGSVGRDGIDAALVDLFYRHVPPAAFLLNPLLALSFAFLLRDHLPGEIVTGWLVLISFVSLIIPWRIHRYRRAREQKTFRVGKWRREFTLHGLINGVVWGAGGALLFVPAQLPQGPLGLLVIGGLAAGAVLIHSSLPQALFCFLIPVTMIPAVGTSMGHNTGIYAVALLLYLAFLAYLHRVHYMRLIEWVRLRSRETLKEREEYFCSLIENSLDWLAVIGADGAFLLLSPSVNELLGWNREGLAGRSAMDYLHPDDQAMVEREFERVLTEGGTSSIEARWSHREGGWVLFQGLLRRLGGDEPALVMNARDVTERRAIERDLRGAKEAAEKGCHIKDQFLTSMNHEIRTPLHAMQGMADLLGETPLSARQKEYVTALRQALGHLTHLVDEVLDYSLMHGGGLTLARQPFDLRELLNSVVGLLAPRAHAKGLKLVLTTDIGGAPLRIGDSERLRQVLVNLVGNAVKFTERGEVQVTIEEKSGRLHFVVAHTGRGITPEEQERLFTPFYQVDGSSTREFSGAGLGLAISRGLVEAMGGRVEVESRPGEGTTFRFDLRLPQAKGPPVEPSHLQGDGLPPARLLVVDDVEVNLMVMREFFRDTPCRLDYARNGREAVSAWEEGHYDLILMDIQMPEMDGLQATGAIRRLERQRGRQGVVIVALTAGALNQDRSKAFAVGCNDFLSKPVAKSQLLTLVAAHLTRWKGNGVEWDVEAKR